MAVVSELIRFATVRALQRRHVDPTTERVPSSLSLGELVGPDFDPSRYQPLAKLLVEDETGPIAACDRYATQEGDRVIPNDLRKVVSEAVGKGNGDIDRFVKEVLPPALVEAAKTPAPARRKSGGQ